jgi:UDP-GlcNAc:undecaprenyl-phosphate GlcNAc-1-phosphate transferase
VTPLTHAAALFAGGLAVAAGATALLRRVAPWVGAVASPRPDRWHRSPVPLLGGVAMWIGVVLSLGWFEGVRALLHPAIIVSTLAMGVGIYDDFVRLKPSTKLTAQIALASLAVYSGIVAEWTGSSAFNAIASIAWIVTLTNGFNLLDNMDGLSAGVAVIAALALLGMTDSSAFAFSVAAALAGAGSGFLLFNFPPATIFMGDSGSLFLGSLLAMLALTRDLNGQTGLVAALGVPVLLLLIPIFDTTFVSISRLLSRRSATMGGRDHTSHRLVAFGFSERQAVLMLYSFAALGGLTAVTLMRVNIPESHLALMMLVVGLTLLAVQLARVRVYGGQDFAALRDARYTPLLIDVTYKRRIFEVLLDVFLVGGTYYAAYVLRFDTELPEYYGYFVTSLPIVLACHAASYFSAGVYRGVWRQFTLTDLLTHARGIVFGVLSSVMVLVYLYRFEGYSRGVFLIHALCLLVLLPGSRASFRLLQEMATRHRSGGRRSVIYGAGDGGSLLLRELRNNQAYGLDPVGFIDDGRAKQGQRIAGIPVIGDLDSLPGLIASREIDVVVLSTAKLPPERRERVVALCEESGTELLQFTFLLEPVRTANVRR